MPPYSQLLGDSDMHVGAASAHHASIRRQQMDPSSIMNGRMMLQDNVYDSLHTYVVRGLFVSANTSSKTKDCLRLKVRDIDTSLSSMSAMMVDDN